MNKKVKNFKSKNAKSKSFSSDMENFLAKIMHEYFNIDKCQDINDSFKNANYEIMIYCISNFSLTMNMKDFKKFITYISKRAIEIKKDVELS